MSNNNSDFETAEQQIDIEIVNKVIPPKYKKTNIIPKELVERYQSGSEKAANSLFLIIQEFVHAYVTQSIHGRTKSYLKLLAHESSEDVEQDLAIVCLNALKSYKPHDNAQVTTFLMSAIIRRLINRNISNNKFVRKIHVMTELQHSIDTFDFQNTAEHDESKKLTMEFSDSTYEPTFVLEQIEESNLLQTFCSIAKDDPWVIEVFTEKKSIVKVAKKYNLELKEANNILKYYLNQMRIIAFNKQTSNVAIQRMLVTVTKDDPWVLSVLTGKQTIQSAAISENISIKNARSIVHYYIEQLKEDCPGLENLCY